MKNLSWSKDRLNEINKLWMKKSKILIVIFVILYFISLIDEFFGVFDGLAKCIGNLIPMIDGLSYSRINLQHLSAKYFSLIALAIPIFVVWVLWEDDVITRCSYGFSRMRQNTMRVIFSVYFLGVPILIFSVYLVLFAPFGYSEVPGNFGQTVFYLMLNSKFGLLAFGCFFGICLGWALLFLCWFISFPFMILFKK